jgi:NDP-sugar pyrophosphorylase family protein
MAVWWRELQAHSAMAAMPRDVGEMLDVHPEADVAVDAVFDTSKGPISIGARTRICRGAYVQGPVAVGSDCLIGDLAVVRGATTIGSETRIGFATEIKNAVIAEGVTIGPQCFVADSKIEAGAYLGAQVRTSNHRLDRRNVEVMVDGKRVDSGVEKLGCFIGAGASLGIQVIVLPGREIAPGSTFAPRTTVERNLPAGRYRLAQRLESF